MAALSSQAAFTLSLTIGALYSAGTTDAPFQTAGVGGAIGVLVVDTTDQGQASFPQGLALNGKNLTVGSDWGSGYRVMAVMTAINNTSQGADTSGGAASYFFGATQSIDLTSTTFGATVDATRDDVAHQFALYWFPAILDTNAATATANPTGVTAARAVNLTDFYGFYTNTTNPNSGTAGNNIFATPAGGTGTNRITQARTEDLIADTADAGNVTAGLNLANTTFLPTLAVNPVPEPSTYALFAGVIALGIAYRRNRKA